ncbi:hypothetical protein ACQF36_10965 [Streptomyces sp. Marseille-Q5077]|uniref:hypothetical protein n=1 Tax=Streptomyces sp. Marseille-Q5077 TaxID=3418995 RepID=UPI003CFCF43D
MRRMRVAAVCGAAVMAVAGGVTVAPAAGAVSAPEAVVAYHGSAAMSGGRVAVRFTPYRLGTGAVPDPTVAVRLRWSAPLADRQALPDRCARAGERIVMCRVGALDADGVGEPVGLRVRLRGAPSEVLVEFDTVRSGGAAGVDRGNDQQRVLVLDTGDSYHF